MNNIINTYLEYLEYQGKSLDIGIIEINQSLGRKLDKTFFSHMRHGSKSVGKDLHRYLVDECYKFMCEQSKYKNVEKFEKAINGLMPPRSK